MKVRTSLAAAFTVIFSVGALFPGSAPAAAGTQSAAAAASPRAKKMKAILSRLVRQDEYLDETIDILDSANGNFSPDDISTLHLSLKMIKGNLDTISDLNKKQFAEARPNSALTTYTRTILSYSRRVSRKVVRINGLVARAALKNKGTGLRDAVTSKTGGKAVKGRKLTRILEERKAMERLSADIKTLKASSNRLTATSKWLHIVSR